MRINTLNRTTFVALSYEGSGMPGQGAVWGLYCHSVTTGSAMAVPCRCRGLTDDQGFCIAGCGTV